MKPLLKTRTAMAALLGVSRTTLYQMEAAGCPFPAGKCHVDWALEWLKNNPDAAKPWLEGVTTFDGGDASAAVKAALAK